jgi:predicted Zn-dependent protease
VWIRKIIKTKHISTYDELPDSAKELLMQLEIPGIDPKDIIKDLKRFTETYPNYIPAKLNYAAILLDMGKTHESKNAYHNILRQNPGNLGAFAGLSTACFEIGEHSDAERYANKAIDGGYNWSPCYRVIAKIREKNGNLKAAAEAYLEAYRLHPHGWNNLESYCKIKNRKYTPPTEKITDLLSSSQVKDLCNYIDYEANKEDDKGDIPGCNHTLLLTEKWSMKNGLDIIDVYQFVNAHGGFCDCEVVYNVVQSIEDDKHDEEGE